MPISSHTDPSINTIRRFFNAYLLHKYAVEYLIKLGPNVLVRWDWVHSSKASEVHKQLEKLQDVLNFNVKNLAQLVRQAL